MTFHRERSCIIGFSLLIGCGLYTQTVSAQLDYSIPYTFTTLAGRSFWGSADGVGPLAQFFLAEAVAVDRNGNVYVADTENHTIRKVTSAGAVTTLAGYPGVPGNVDGVGSAARFSSPRDIAVDSAGNVYVGAYPSIRKITPGGVVSTLTGVYGFSLTIDNQDNLYFSDGENIQKIAASGSVSTIASGISGVSGLAVDGQGMIYVTIRSNHIVRQITPGGVISTIAGLDGNSGRVNGAGSDARFSEPVGVAVGLNGAVFVVEYANHDVRQLVPSVGGWVVSTFAGGVGIGTWGHRDGTGQDSGFWWPEGLAADSSGNLYVADTYNGAIRKVTSAGIVTTLAGAANGGGGTGNADGLGSAARFGEPDGVAVDSQGNVYVADSLNSSIRKVTSAGLVSTLAGGGSGDGVGSAAGFSMPMGLAVDNFGNIFVADTFNDRIRKVTPAGLVSTLRASDGIAAAGPFSSPMGIAADGGGNIYVADTFNHRICKMTPQGQNWAVTTIAGDPDQSEHADGINNQAHFVTPTGLAVDSHGTIYVADYQDHTIRKMVMQGADWAVSTLAGSPGVPGIADGMIAMAKFSFPFGIAVDGAGNLYTDSSGGYPELYLVRRITRDGLVTTLAGNLAGSVDGTGKAASFFTPYGIAVDHAGNIYVADSRNFAIRKGVFTDYAPAHPLSFTVPPSNGQLTINLEPSAAAGQWRFPWEFGWRSSGATASNLGPGNYAVEFRNVPGWLAIPSSLPAVVVQNNAVSVTSSYYPTLSQVDPTVGGTLTVILGANPPAGAGWRLLGDTTPFLSSGTRIDLLPGTYLIEFAGVSGRIKPSTQALQVKPGLQSWLSVSYLLPASLPGGMQLPFAVDLGNEVSDEINYPFGFNGQLQSDIGYGSGVAVETNVVLTAAHLVFNDQTLAYVSRAHWFLRRNVPLNEPFPQTARGFYLLSGYASQRTNDLTSSYSPGQSSPPSRNLDVAALYFLEPVAGGGHGGYLPSDAVQNMWLSSTALKMLVGYPIDGSQFGDASIVPGKMYQTDPQPYPLSLAPDAVPGQQEVYLAPWLLGYPGNSGGPLYVQMNGSYYPAGVYLGTLFSGSQPSASVVRAIDSKVSELIHLAATQGDKGTNNTSGGVITVIPSLAVTAQNPGYVQCHLGPTNAVQAGGKWGLQGAPETTFGSDWKYTLAVTSSDPVALAFKTVSGWNLPPNQTVTVSPGQITVVTASYTPASVAPASVVARRVFYNNSAWDGSNAAANSADDSAVAPDKSALLPGGTATLANYTSYSKGINGIMVDIAGLGGTPAASDFIFKVGNDNAPSGWSISPTPSSITIRPGAGSAGSARITLIWPDNAIEQRWLQVTVLATARTGLAAADVFYFGNAIGECGNLSVNAQVDVSDENGARQHPANFLHPAAIDNLYDYNRDQRVDVSDENLARQKRSNFLTALKLISVPIF